MNKAFNKGFTLIELLVVIAIIGILAGIVLASLGNARSGGSDAKVKGQLFNLRTAMEIYYNSAAGNGKYGSNAAQVNATCSGAGAAGTGFVDSKVAPLVDSNNYPTGSSPVCNMGANGSAWAVSADLTAAGGPYWCVDSTGISATTSTQIATNDNTCY